MESNTSAVLIVQVLMMQGKKSPKFRAVVLNVGETLDLKEKGSTKTFGEGIFTYPLHLLVREEKTTRKVTQVYREGQMVQAGLEPHVPYRVVIMGTGFETQEREVMLQPGRNVHNFFVAKAGAGYYRRGRVLIPFKRDEEKVVVLDEPAIKTEVTELRSLLDKHKAFSISALLEMDQARSAGSIIKQPVKKKTQRFADDKFIGTELKITARGAARKENLKALHKELQQQPGMGKLAVLLPDNNAGARMFAGDIVLTLNKGLTGEEMDKLCSEYGLRFLFSAGWDYYFAMVDGPDVDFDKLLDRILIERPEVSAAEPVIEEEPVLFTRVVPADFLFGLQWDQHIIQTPEAWFDLQTNGGGVANQYGSNTIVIGVSDLSGIDTGHQDFSGNVNGVAKIVAHYDFVAGALITPASLTNPHGTNCAGSATAKADAVSAANPAFREGIAGSAPGCRLVAVRVNLAQTQMYNWYAGMFVGAAPAQLPNIVDVSTNSTGGPGALSAVEMRFLDFATDFGRVGRGMPLCYAAGNSNGGPTIASTNRFATYNRVICVSASSLLAAGTRETRAPYSCWGPENDVCAPSDNRSVIPMPRQVPPVDYGIITTANRQAVVNPNWWDGNLPGAPGRVGVANISDNLGAAITPAGSPSLTLANPNVQFAGVTAVLVEGVNSPSAEGLQVTGTPPGNTLTVRHIGPIVPYGFAGYPNTQRSHNAAVNIVGGAGDYTDSFGGTSHSTPLTAGVIALMLSAKPSLSWVEALHILRTSARKLDVGETNGNGLWFDSPAMVNQVLNAALTNVVSKVPFVITALAANVNAPSDPLLFKNHGTSVIRLTNIAGFELGDAIRIRQGATQEFHVVEGINPLTNELTIDALRNNFTTAAGGTSVEAGRIKPVFSQYYGFGRVNAAKAVVNARTYNHAHRDLVIRNTMTDTGLVDIIAPATQIHSPDIWIRNQADPAMPAPAYDQPGPHQNPQMGVNRFIYARIKNIGTHESNLDAWVHFYVALSDHTAPPANAAANPTNITTPFLFPGDFNSPVAVIRQKSWADDVNSDITLPAPTGITGGTQKVYHVRDTAVVNVPNQPIPAGTVVKADPNNINTGVTVVRVQWNAADLPPVGTPFGIYLLAYVSPVDGARQGREAGRNNNMSYREIAFADFNLLTPMNLPLPSSVNVDEFGTPVTTAFAVQAVQSIGSMLTERVVIEISRTSDNGSVETAFFRRTGAAWRMEDAMGNPGITWATMTAPTQFGSATLATGAQTNISFAGTFACAMQHHKVTIRAVIHSARPGATRVPIAEESFDITVVANVPATPSATATNPAPPAPDSFVFTDFATLVAQPSANKSFGPIDSGHFRITSLFTAATAPKAYAVTSGVVMVQVVDANRVNLILRPMRQPGLGMTPVKYYIYRGLRKDDFFNAANTEVRPAAGAKEFIARIWPVFIAQNVMPTPPFPARALGWDPPNQNPTAKIDEYFFATGSNFQYALVKAGEYMADFYHTGGNEFGFEIVLEEGTAQPTISNVQLADYVIDVSGLLENTDAQKLTKRLAREEILNYLDPAAFYGMHFNGTVRRKPSGTWTGQNIVTNIVNKFFSKRAVYVDIRNENGNSYNFYQNYRVPTPHVDAGKNIKHGTASASLITAVYETMSWPVLILHLQSNTANPVNPLVIQLRRNDNLKPVLYVEHGTITSATTNNRFADENQLFVQPPPYTQEWTNDVTFTSPNTGSTATKDSIAWVFKLHYGRIIDAATVWPATVVKTEKTTDNLFGPIDLQAPWGVITSTRWIAAQDKKYVDGQLLGFGQVMERGVAYEGDASSGRVIFYAALLDQHRNPVPGFTPRRGITGGITDGVSFLQAARNFDQYRLQFGALMDGTTPIVTLRLVPGAVVNAGSANGAMFLGITAAQLMALQALPGLNNNYPRTIAIEEVGPVGAGKKYRLGVQGLQADGTYRRSMPTAGNEIFAYSLEGLFYYTAAFSSSEPLPTTYVRNVEEEVGKLNLPTVGPVNYLINGLTQGANGNFRVAADLSQLISVGGQFQIANNPNNAGTYTLVSLTVTPGPVTTLQVANVPGASTSGSLQLLPRKIEEHFINLDPNRVIAGTNSMKTIVDQFVAAVAAVPNDTTTVAALHTHIDNFGTQLLNRARAAVRENTHANPDDRPLYWARIKMMVILKSHAFMLQNIAPAENLVKRFDDRTRGITPAPSFAAAGANKKALVIGFDPFFLKPAQPNHNSYQSNPSGVAALFLHNATEIPGMFIQSVIIPVRFEDFDAGRIDNLIDPFLHGAGAVDMIMTVSQDVDLRFHVDRFCTRYRTRTTPDNLGVSGKLAVHYELNAAQTALTRLAANTNLPRFLETTLPASVMVPGSVMPVAAAGRQVVKTVIFDQKFTPEGGPEQGVDNINTFSGTSPAPGVEVVEGSGGSYLSNEVFYRTSLRRTQRASTINTGHLHVPKLQQNFPPHADALFEPARFKYFVDTMIQILKDTLPGI
jgi:hypothetical protein